MKKIFVSLVLIFLSLTINGEISQSGITNLKQLDKNEIIDLISGNELIGFISDGPFEGKITQTFYKNGKYETIFEDKIFKGIWKVEGKSFLTKNNNSSNFGVMYWYTGKKDGGDYAYIIAQGKIFHQYHKIQSVVQINQEKKKAADRKKAAERQRIADAKKVEDRKKAAERQRIADAKKVEDRKKAAERQRIADAKKLEDRKKAAERQRIANAKKLEDKRKAEIKRVAGLSDKERERENGHFFANMICNEAEKSSGPIPNELISLLPALGIGTSTGNNINSSFNSGMCDCFQKRTRLRISPERIKDVNRRYKINPKADNLVNESEALFFATLSLTCALF